MATLPALRKKAQELGIPNAEVRKANTSEKLQALIMDTIMGGGTKAPARKTTTRTPAKPTRKAAAPAKPVKRTPAKAATPAKKSTPVKKPVASSNGNGDAGRHVLGRIDYSVVDGWNARPGSIPDQIVKSLKRFKGDRERVFNHLLPNIWDFVGKKMADGSRRTKDSAEEMLRYRISRTAWDFAMKTGQHEKSTNRATYGQGTRNGSAPAKKPTRKPAGASRTPAKAKVAAAPARRKTAAQKPVQRRTRPAKAPVTRTRRPVAKKKRR